MLWPAIHRPSKGLVQTINQSMINMSTVPSLDFIMRKY
jgi:hypothetical protein